MNVLLNGIHYGINDKKSISGLNEKPKFHILSLVEVLNSCVLFVPQTKSLKCVTSCVDFWCL